MIAMELLNESFGFLTQFPVWSVVTGILLVTLLFAFWKMPLWLWAVSGVVILWGLSAPVWLLGVYVVLCLIFTIKPLRRTLVSRGIMKLLDALNFLPTISETERTAIEAGNVWVDGELFSGKPDLRKLAEEDYPDLSEKERTFLDGPVEELCEMVKDWDVFVQKEFTDEVWEYMRKQGFFGLVIPE